MLYPKISVLVPVYNSAPYLKATIQSVLNQTFQDFELILLNDASPDNSEDIILNFNDSRIKYYKNDTNLGISPSRNKLMDLAQGEYLAILDNDDICLPQRLEIQSKFLDEHPDVSICGTWFELFTSNHQMPFYKRWLINLGWIWCHPHNPVLSDAIKGNVFMHPTAMYRKADFHKHNIRYNAEYTPAEDYDIAKQALFKGLKIVNIPQILLKYNLHGNNFSIKKKQQLKEADKKIKQEIAIFMDIKNYKPYPYWKVMLAKLRLKYFKKG